MYNDLRAYIKSKIENITGLTAYYLRANDNASYPYVVFSLDDYSVSDMWRKQYSLTTEFWAKNSPKTIIDKAELLGTELAHFYDTSETFAINIHKETATQPVDDSDKTIYRLSGSYDVKVVEKG